MRLNPRVPEECRACTHFRDHPEEIEQMIPGLASMSSGFASVLGNDGICTRHDRICAANSICGDFARAAARGRLGS